MASRRTRRSTQWGELALYGLFGVIVLGGLGAGGLYLTGYFDPAAGPSREGQLACPALSRPVDAYSAITRGDLINPQTGQLNVVWLPEQTAEKVIRDLSQIVGRVAKRDKVSGMALTEADFFPPGTRPGLAAGIPPGMKAVTIPSNRIDGLSLLRMGDRFDLVASLPSDPDAVPPTEYAVLLGGIKPPDTRAGQLAKQTGVRTLVSNGQMIALTRGRTRSTEGQQGLVVPAGRSSRGSSTSTVATIGVAPEEVTPLTEALGLDSNIVCITHSGRSDDESISESSDIDLTGLVSVVAPFRGVDAYAAIGQSDLVDPVSGRLNEYYFQPTTVDRAWLTDFSQLVGRVPRRDIGPGEPIREEDLLPAGSRAGVLAGAPKGTTVIEVPASRFNGAGSLVDGDAMSIYVELPSNVVPRFPEHEWATIQGGVRSQSETKLRETMQNGISLVAEGVVLLTRRNDTGETTDSADATKLVLAVPDDRVISFTRAVNGEQRLAIVGQAATEKVDPISPFAARRPKTPLQSSSALLVSTNDERFAVQRTVPDEFDAVNERDLIAVPVTARDVPPFTSLTAEDFVDPVTGKLREILFPAEQVDSSWMLSVKDLLDRVTKTEIKSGRIVSTERLLPTGTTPGEAAGVPAGYAAIEVNSFQIDGLEIPNVLDRIDLIAARPMSSVAPQARSAWATAFNAETFYQPQADDLFMRADNRTLSQAAIVLNKAYRNFEFMEEATTETIGEETQIDDDGATRRGVQRKTEPKLIEREGLVCTLAVPTSSVPLILEALSVQRVDGGGAAAGDTGNAPANDTGAGGANNEVAIYVVMHSSRPEVASPSVPTIDIVREWIERWSDQLRRYQDATQFAPTQVVEQIRGGAQATAQYYNGIPVTGEEATLRRYGSTIDRVLPSQTPPRPTPTR